MGRIVCPRCHGEGTIESDATVKMGREQFDAMIADAMRSPPPPRPISYNPPPILENVIGERTIRDLPSSPITREAPREIPRDIPKMFPDERETLASQSWMIKRVKKIERSNRRIALIILACALFVALGGVLGWLWQRRTRLPP